MIIDCFTFYNELEMLKFRLKELNDVVDYFVIVEANHSHNKNIKELFFDTNKNLYSKYLDKIIHIIVDDMPNTNNAWDNENHQRRCIDRGIKQLKLSDDDTILITDLDEIPDPETINKIKLKEIIIDDAYALMQDFYYYNINTKHKKKWDPWPKVVDYKSYIKKYNSDCQKIRKLKKQKRIKKGGWHFSYFMDEAAIANKIKNFGHQEFNSTKFTDTEVIAQKIKSGEDLYNRDHEKWNYIDIKDNNYLPNNYKMLL